MKKIFFNQFCLYICDIKITFMSYTIDQIKQNLASNPAWTERAIIRLFEYQTRDEQITEHTHVMNGVGFNGPDSKTLTYYAKWLLRGNHLSGKHLEKAQRLVPKYAGQIARIIESKQNQAA